MTNFQALFILFHNVGLIFPVTIAREYLLICRGGKLSLRRTTWMKDQSLQSQEGRIVHIYMVIVYNI